MTQTIINAEDCSVQERSVSIRVLTVGTKQITQSLYKQLPEEQVIDNETGELTGVLWGWVNLHIDCNVDAIHKHIVWENNGQLRRSCEFPVCNTHSIYPSLLRELRHLTSIYVCLVALTGRGFNHWNTHNSARLTLTIKGIRAEAILPDVIISLFKAPEEIKYHRDRMNTFTYSKKMVEEHIPKMIKGILSGTLADCFRSDNLLWDDLQYLNPEQYKSHADVYEAMENLANTMNTLAQTWRESYKAIEDAGQLFVAVSGVWK